MVLALCVLGSLLVWSATKPGLVAAGANPRTYLYKEALWFAIGLVLMVAVAMMDIRRIRSCTPVVYGVTLLGLVAVLSPLGSVVNGAHAWINLPGGFQVEPSEFAKLAEVLICGLVLSRLKDGGKRPRPREIALAIVCAAPLIALVVKEPALGVALVLVAILIGMIVLSGLKLRWLAALALFGTAAATLALKAHLLKSYQLQRFTSFTNPSANLASTGYNAQQAKIAVGSGGLTGHGLFHGALTAGNFVPSQSTDFIFTGAGEELGFAGCIAIVVLLGVVVVRAMRIAARADDQFGTLVAAGIAIWFAFQTFVNIGMTIGIMPITGLPLPFISYGGSAAFADMIAIGILQSVHRKRTGLSAAFGALGPTPMIADRPRLVRGACRSTAAVNPCCPNPPDSVEVMSVESVYPRLEPLLPQVTKPVQYVGGELNSVVKDWESADVRWALMYPDAYEVGLPNQGLQILYEVLNGRDGVLAERTYSVWPDLEALMREHGIPQFTVDGHRPVGAFDLLGVSFATELGYTNLLTALDLAGIPLAAADREDSHPLVLAGGHAAFNPEPIAEFLDGAVLGDGEQAVLTITGLVREWKARGRPGGRDGLLLRLAAEGGVYVPRFYDVRYLADGRIGSVRPNRPGVPGSVAKHTLMDLDDWAYPRKPLVPVAETIHERYSVEIFRGCTRGCRFCQAGMITRPVRERSKATIAGMVETGLEPRSATARSGCCRCPAPTTARFTRWPAAWPTGTRTRRPGCPCRPPGWTRST